jgi:poly-gamma-glutamate capsule biosynthesis protein CapA/YwtB (metallophosphatase superfamily)
MSAFFLIPWYLGVLVVSPAATPRAKATRSEAQKMGTLPFSPRKPVVSLFSELNPADTIENFDDGMVALRSFPGEDVHPDSWTLDTLVTCHNSPYSLKLFGNTWKLETIVPIHVDTGDVWEVAAYIARLGEIQGLGLTSATDTLFYSFAGTEQVNPDDWVTVYQGAFPQQTWNTYRLPVAEDWLARFGYLPAITGIVFVNDRDTAPRAIIYFDDVLNITSDLPVAPQVEIWYTIGEATRRKIGTLPASGGVPVFRRAASSLAASSLWNVTVQFHSRVTDPDSRSHEYYWYFGDDSTALDSNPSHTYVVSDDHQYTVLLEVVDSTGLWGRATCQVTVDPGPTRFPIRMNFVGDIMLARRYETPGGIIDTLGPEGIFDPTLPWLGNAADITVANLECPLTTHGTPHPTKPIVFRGRPTNVAGLVHAGIDVVSLANNHAGDYGLEGMSETQHVLDSCGILYSGAGANSYQAYLPVFHQKSGVNIAFLASCNRTGQYDNYQPYLDAGYNKPGFAMLDTFHIFQQIRAVQPVADLIVAEMHAGDEYALTPNDAKQKADISNIKRVGEFESWRVEELNSRTPQLLNSPTPELRVHPRFQNDNRSDDEFYSPFALMPSPYEIELRHRTIDRGADLVICHHPHVLQGLEVYHGKLIAHSLGNFAFDQDYPETYPSVILNAEIAETGFCDYSLTPVYIDDYIPVRARGGLGLHILDYLAWRSKDLGTYLIVHQDSVTAEIVLDTLNLTRRIHPGADQLPLQEDNGYWVSAPLRLPRHGSLSAVLSATPPRNWQFRIGREIIWFGNCEDEGSTMWLLNQPDARYDTIAHQGCRSLRQTRAVGSDSIVTNLEDRMVCYSDSARYTLHGWLKTQNAKNVGIVVGFYNARTGTPPIGTSDLGAQVTGTTDWTFYHREFLPANQTGYFDVRLRSESPQSGGSGDAWFDDPGIIEWEGWQSLASPTLVPAPNDYYWIQLRTDVETPTATISYEETDYDSPSSVAEARSLEPMNLEPLNLYCHPNPANSAPTIRYDLPRAAEVVLRIYNVLGQEVRTLVHGIQVCGPQAITWDRRDNQGRRLGSGAYFCRLRAGRYEQSRKLVLSD